MGGCGDVTGIDRSDFVDGLGCVPLVAVGGQEQGLGNGHEVVVCPTARAAEVLDGFEVHGGRKKKGDFLRRGDWEMGTTGWRWVFVVRGARRGIKDAFPPLKVM